MIKIFYGQNSLHCQVAASLYLANLSKKNLSEVRRLTKNHVANKLIYVGRLKEEEIYYFAIKKDLSLFPKIIRSLEEMYQLEESELVEVSGSNLYPLAVLVNLVISLTKTT